MSKTDRLIAKVILDVPLPALDYLIGDDQEVVVGDRVLVTLQNRRMVGIVVGIHTNSAFQEGRLKKILATLSDTVPLRDEFLSITKFASDYYLRSWGEVAIGALAQFFRRQAGVSHDTQLKKIRQLSAPKQQGDQKPQLNDSQQYAVQQMTEAKNFCVFLLYGVTGSGKTEVYLHVMQEKLREDPQAQVLLLVPEINLTPQLEDRVRRRFSHESVVTLHSSLSQTERARNWLAVHEGRARVLVGTRLAVFASFQHLSLIIVDEEHDPSYKADDGLRHSARDIAVKRAHQNNIICVLGSATPSLETWYKAQSGHYSKLELLHRAVSQAQLPRLVLIDMRGRHHVLLAEETMGAIDAALEKKEQVLIFINRRGYSPVISCAACGWVSQCIHCSGFTVYHKRESSLICHHCSKHYKVPLCCPVCGNTDIVPLGSGSQRLEEEIAQRWPQANILRIDRDSVRRKGEAEKAFSLIHEGKADIVVGTQMIAKGHDFKKVSLVVILNVDGQLASPNVRAEEQLFSTMMQVAGRAGRDGGKAEVIVQTKYPEHALFEAMRKQSFPLFAQRVLEDRKQTMSPPFVAQALLRAESASLEQTLAFLNYARAEGEKINDGSVWLYDPIPMTLVRLMDQERGQLLVESLSKVDLHRFLIRWKEQMHWEIGNVKWNIDVDPVDL